MTVARRRRLVFASAMAGSGRKAVGGSMKRILRSTSALIAVGLAAGEASAASALKLGITGFYRNSIGGSFGNSPTSTFVGPAGTTFGLGNFDRQAVSMRQEIRINFTG